MNLSPWQSWWVNSWPHRWHLRRHIPQFLKTCPDPFRGEVLEVAAGHGWTSQQILKTFPQVELTATDIDRRATEMFAQLRQYYGRRLKVKEASVFKLPFDRDAFDIVIVINLLGHMNTYEIRRALQELLRVTRPGGIVGISNHSFLLLTNPSSRTHIEEILREESCEIVYSAGKARYDMWIRKAYPIPA